MKIEPFVITISESDESDDDSKQNLIEPLIDETGKRRYRSKNSKISYKCVECGKNFNFWCQLQYHMDTIHHPTYVNCQICQALLKETYLKTHMRKVHHERGQFEVPAEIEQEYNKSSSDSEVDTTYQAPKRNFAAKSTGWAQQTSSIDNKSMVKSCNVDLTCELCNNHIVYADEMAFIHSDCLPSIAEKLQPKQEISVDFKNHDRSSKSKHNGQRKSSHYSPILKIPLKPFMRMKKSELLKCSTCKTQFENAEMGRQHYRLVHDRNCIECMYCDSVLTKKEKLDEHMRKYH